MTLFAPATAADRAASTEFVGRVAQLDPAGLVRLIGDGDRVELWARGGFGVMATLRVAGRIDPDPLTAYATNLVAALAVSRADVVDPGTDAAAEWHGQLPPVGGWQPAGSLPAADIEREVRAAMPIAQDAVEIDRADELRAKTKATVPPVVLDRSLMTTEHDGVLVPISMRMLFALSGMGFVAPATCPIVTVAVTSTWLRLDTPSGSVARRRMADLPLV